MSANAMAKAFTFFAYIRCSLQYKNNSAKAMRADTRTAFINLRAMAFLYCLERFCV